jgi:hypothetical protein
MHLSEEQIFWGKERKLAERETRLSTCHQLFCALYYLRHNPPFDLLAFFFDVSPGLIHAYVRKILGIMDAHFEQNESIRSRDNASASTALSCRDHRSWSSCSCCGWICCAYLRPCTTGRLGRNLHFTSSA